MRGRTNGGGTTALDCCSRRRGDRSVCVGEAFILGVVETDAVLAQLPAEIHFLIVNARGEIEQPDVQIFHHAAGFLNLIERGLDGFFQLVAFQPYLRGFFVGHRQAPGTLDALRQRPEFPIHIIHLAPRFHRFDQDRFELRAQALGFREREIFSSSSAIFTRPPRAGPLSRQYKPWCARAERNPAR